MSGLLSARQYVFTGLSMADFFHFFVLFLCILTTERKMSERISEKLKEN